MARIDLGTWLRTKIMRVQLLLAAPILNRRIEYVVTHEAHNLKQRIQTTLLQPISLRISQYDSYNSVDHIHRSDQIV